MSIYVVGDIQGCYDPLRRLLDQVSFDPIRDRLWSVVDLVNRGPRSLQVLRFLKSLGPAATAVLGNHDLMLLAVSLGVRRMRVRYTFGDVLSAPDLSELQQWLLGLPLAHYERDTLMVHAGVIPAWDVEDTLSHAGEVEAVLRSTEARDFLSYMHGDTPPLDASSRGWKRLREITDILTRLRFCTADSRIDLTSKEGPEHAPPGMLPWYAHPQRRSRDTVIVFGHWAALGGKVSAPNLFALDTGCVWGDRLTALRLDDKQRFSCECGK